MTAFPGIFVPTVLSKVPPPLLSNHILMLDVIELWRKESIFAENVYEPEVNAEKI